MNRVYVTSAFLTRVRRNITYKTVHFLLDRLSWLNATLLLCYMIMPSYFEMVIIVLKTYLMSLLYSTLNRAKNTMDTYTKDERRYETVSKISVPF